MAATASRRAWVLHGCARGRHHIRRPRHDGSRRRRDAGAVVRAAERRRPWLRPLRPGRCEPGLPAAPHRGHRRSADPGQRVGHALGQHAGVACRGGRIPRRKPQRPGLCHAGVLAASWDRGANAPGAGPRGDAADRHRSRLDEQREVRLVLRVQGRGARSAKPGLDRGAVAARRQDRGTHIRGDGRDRDGARTGRTRSAGVAGDPAGPARSDAEFRSQGAVRLRDARAFSRPRRARTGVRAPPPGG